MSAEPTSSEAEDGGEQNGDVVVKDIADHWCGVLKLAFVPFATSDASTRL